MKRKIIALGLAVAMLAVAAVSSTLAYLTDTDKATNVFTVGSIDIELDEVNKVMVAGEDRTKAFSVQNDDGITYSGVMPTFEITKKPVITNTGKSDAFVRVFVTMNNSNLANKAIDEFYEDKTINGVTYVKNTADIQNIYDKVFNNWEMTYIKSDAVNMRGTVLAADVADHIAKAETESEAKVVAVDSLHRTTSDILYYKGNFFMSPSEENGVDKGVYIVNPDNSYYSAMLGNQYERLYVYYVYLEPGDSFTLFDGFNIPAEFNAEQNAMFEGLKIEIHADAIQAEGFSGTSSYATGTATEEEQFLSVAREAYTALELAHSMVGMRTYTSKWDGSVDTSWYNDTDTVFTLSTAEQLAGLAELVDGGNTFEGKTVKLGGSIDLANIVFEPIGSYRNKTSFKGTFDGQGNSIINMSQNTWALDNGYYYGDLGLGLFGLVEDATIKNLVMDNASISGESAICGTVAATAYGDCTFENITVRNSKCNDYQYYAGGVVGWASGNHKYTNINVEASTIIGGQWGDFGNANGGVIGGIGSSAVIEMKDCTIACRIDAVNDVVSAYQWYNYRNSGMLIGKVPQTIVNGEAQTVKTPENVTCENVKVIYGDWANYHYCEFAGTGYPFVRVEAGVSVGAYTNVRYGHPTDANGNEVVDDSHVHNEGEKHMELIIFDQLFGGPADHRYCYYGISEYDGVTVVYNNK